MSGKNRVSPSVIRTKLHGEDNTACTTSFTTANFEEEFDHCVEFEFVGAKNDLKKAKLIKVQKDINVSKVYDHLIHEWKIKPPNLIVSVTGGAKNFKMKPRLSRIFRKSLINIAVGTGAWIVTGGTNYGVMKHVGKAVQEYSAVKSRKEAEKVVTIGIATWGVIHERQKLVKEKKHDANNPKDDVNNQRDDAKNQKDDIKNQKDDIKNQKDDVKNQKDDIKNQKEGVKNQKDDIKNPKDVNNQNKNSVLNKNHSHFILVDDGSVGKYGREITFRANFEKHIAKNVEHERRKTLISCVLVQGGEGSLKTVYEALEAGTPVVVVGGSGQWANILATLCTRQTEAKVNQKLIAELLQENMMKWETSDDLSKWTNMAEECVKKKKLITVFQLDTPDSVQELDVAILKSLADTQKSEEKTERQLELALAWNRSDIASSHILTDDCNISQDALLKLFLEAIKKDNAKFVQVFLDYGLDLKTYMLWDSVIDLYKNITNTPTYCKEMLKRKSQSNELKNFDRNALASVMKKLLGPSCKQYQTKENKPVDPLREIFQWSVIMNRKELARVIWESMTDQLPAAVAATAMLKQISQMNCAKSSRDSLNEHAEEYASITQHILTQCMKDDPKKTKKLLTRKHDKKWGGLDCMQMAVDASSRDVVAHPAVQNYLNSLWKNNMDFNEWKGYIHLLLAVVFIFPLYWIDFSETDEVADVEPKQNKNDESGGSGNAKNAPKSKFRVFYEAPITKYVVNVIFHLLFLVLFSYILLFNFYPYTGTLSTLEAPSIPEWLLVVWALILSLDEIYAIVRQKNKNLEHSVRFWFTDHWNKIDTLALLLFLIGFGLRFHPDLNPSRIILSLSFIVYCIRLLHVFTLSQTIGPKVVMVGNMLKDLWFFVFIVAIFLFAYGVTSQGMLYPNETRIGTAIYGIFYKPYWQIYGELFLDEINYDPASSAFECTNNQTLLNAGYQRCPEHQEVVPVISAFYMLLANILLLNLLIAMFSYTFTKLEENTEFIWKYQRYELIEEYLTRPPLPAPFSVVWYAMEVVKNVFNKQSPEKTHDPEKPDDPELDDHDLSKFEQWNTDTYVSEKRAEEALALPTRIQGMNDRLDNVVSSIEGFVEHFSRQKKISKRVKKLEANQAQVSESLQWIMQAMQDNNTVPKNLEQNVHVKALTSPYPQSNVVRFPVPGVLVSWTISMALYEPVFYTAEVVAKTPIWADPPLEGSVVKKLPQFNAYDSHYKVDRRSHMGKYLIVDGLPRNPMGRTGIWGRGLLGRYGPNHAADPIVTRWLKGDDGNDLEIEGKRVLEFIAIKREDTGDWAIPGGMVDPGEKVNNTLIREFEEEVKCGNPDMEPEKLEQKMEKLKQFLKENGTEVFRGYADDHRNTDNSWIESVAMNFHDDSGEVLGNLVVSPGYEAKGAKWTRIEKSLKLFASHQDYIEKIAVMREAHF